MSGRSHDDTILQRCQGECWDGALALLALIPGRLGNMAQDMLLLDVKLSNCILLYIIVFYYMSLHRITKHMFICVYMLLYVIMYTRYDYYFVVIIITLIIIIINKNYLI